MRYWILLLALALAAPLPAFATDAWEDCGSGDSKGTVGHRDMVCVDFTGDNPDSNLLNVQNCENFDAHYEADTTGSGTAVTCQIMDCLSPAIDSDACAAIDGVTLTGSGTLRTLYNAAGVWVYWDCTGTIGSEEPRGMLHCHP